jgi:hypothetical protein
VGGGGRRPTDGLVGDVTEVGQGQAAVVEGLTEVLEAQAGLDRDPARVGVDVEDVAVAIEHDQPAVGHRRVGEAVPRADRLDPLTPRRGLDHQRRQLVLGGRMVDRRRPGGLVPGPVAPGHRRRRGHGGSV